MSWTEERIELLKKLWTDGLSASQIAGELGGVTRNAVIGKVHRLGLSGRAKAASAAPARPRPKTVVPRPAPRGTLVTRVNGATALAAHYVVEASPAPMVIEQEVVLPMSRRVQIMELREGMCRWPMGDPLTAEFVFCGADCGYGAPYCGFHGKVAFQPSIDRKRR
jgi:GcrA cell cycle regulator